MSAEKLLNSLDAVVDKTIDLQNAGVNMRHVET